MDQLIYLDPIDAVWPNSLSSSSIVNICSTSLNNSKKYKLKIDWLVSILYSSMFDYHLSIIIFTDGTQCHILFKCHKQEGIKFSFMKFIGKMTGWHPLFKKIVTRVNHFFEGWVQTFSYLWARALLKYNQDQEIFMSYFIHFPSLPPKNVW